MNADEIHQTALAYAESRTPEALEVAVKAALPLCGAIASRFSGRGIELDDLKQVAAMALLAALKSFDPKRGLRFTTYVTPTITGTVRNYIRDKAELIRTPRGLREQASQMERATASLSQALHREPTPREIADELQWSLETVIEVLSSRERSQVSYLDAEDDEGLMLKDRLASPVNETESFETREQLRAALKTLSVQERELIRWRYHEQLSQQLTAQKMNLTQIQVSRMERRILKSLRAEILPL